MMKWRPAGPSWAMVGENGPSSSSDMHHTACARRQPANSAALRGATSAADAVSHDRLASEEIRLIGCPTSLNESGGPARATVTVQRLRRGEDRPTGGSATINRAFTTSSDLP